MLETLLPGVQHLQNIHPLVVHFPIAFLVGAALFNRLAWLLNSDRLAFTGFMVLVLGTLSAAAAVGTGLGAHYGARMVYDYNAGGNACSQPIEFTK